MFTKLEMLGAITISLYGGMAIGYSKARKNLLTGNHHRDRRTEGTRDNRKEETP